MNKLTYIEKIALFRILFDIVNADKIIHEKEIDYLKEIANSLNLVGDYEKDVKELTSFMAISKIQSLSNDVKEEIAQLKRFYVKIGKNKVYAGPIFKENRDKSGEKKLTATGISESIDKFVDEYLAVGDFCSYSFPQKMALIRKLYLTNMVKVADKLMKEVEKRIDNFRNHANIYS